MGRVGLIAGNGSGQRMAEQQQQQLLPWQMLKNGNAFSAPAKSQGDFKLYAAHTHVEVLPCTDRENEKGSLESKEDGECEQWTGECAIASVHPGCVSRRFYVPSHIIEFYFY